MNMKEVLNFIEEVERLKFTLRSGWMYYGIKNPESVAEHSFMVAFLSLIIGLMLIKRNENVDLRKILIMSLIHELGEVKVGDIHLVAKKYLGFENVDRAEENATFDLLNNLEFDELKEIYQEFLKGETNEAKIVRACDKLELLIQAKIYKKIGYTNVDDFFNSDANLNDIKNLKIANELLKELML